MIKQLQKSKEEFEDFVCHHKDLACFNDALNKFATKNWFKKQETKLLQEIKNWADEKERKMTGANAQDVENFGYNLALEDLLKELDNIKK